MSAVHIGMRTRCGGLAGARARLERIMTEPMNSDAWLVSGGEPDVAVAAIEWFDANARDLPWRRPEAGAWGVLVSEIMLQQTPVSRVVPAYEAWLARWPDPAG